MAKTKAPSIRDERAFHNFALVIMTLLALFCVVPFIFGDFRIFLLGGGSDQGYKFIPKEFSLSAY